MLTCIEHAYPQAADRPEAAVAPIGDSYPSIVRRLLAHESHEDWKGTLKMNAPRFIRQCVFEETARVLTNAQVAGSHGDFLDDESVDTASIDSPKEERRTDTTDEESGEVGASRLSGNGRWEAENDQITKTQQQDVQAYLEAKTPDHGSIDERLTEDIRTIREWQRGQRSRLSEQEEDMSKREKELEKEEQDLRSRCQEYERACATLEAEKRLLGSVDSVLKKLEG